MRGPRAPASAAVLIPLREFRDAKTRLSSALTGEERAILARKLAEHVVGAAGSLATVIVTGDHAVAEWARGCGCHVLDDLGSGLNPAVTASVRVLGWAGYGRAIVAHADLPLAVDLSWLALTDGVVIVPDRHDEGTNVLAVPTGCAFEFSYGPHSALRHRAEAVRRGLPVSIVRDPHLSWDVDTAEDLHWPTDLTVPRPEGADWSDA